MSCYSHDSTRNRWNWNVLSKKGKKSHFRIRFQFCNRIHKGCVSDDVKCCAQKNKTTLHKWKSDPIPRKQQKLVTTARKIAKMSTFVYILENLQKPGKPKNDFKAKSRVSLAFSNFSNSLRKVTISRSFFFKFRLKSIFHSFQMPRVTPLKWIFDFNPTFGRFLHFLKTEKKGFKWRIFPKSILGSDVIELVFSWISNFKFSLLSDPDLFHGLTCSCHPESLIFFNESNADFCDKEECCEWVIYLIYY